MVEVSEELNKMREEQMYEVCPNHMSKGQHSFQFDHWCHCDPACEDNVHRACEFCGTPEVNGSVDE